MTLVGIFEYIISVAQRYIVWCCEYSLSPGRLVCPGTYIIYA